MAQFCINIADQDVERVIGAMCANYGYQPNVPNPDFNLQVDPGLDNPEYVVNTESPSEFANRMTRDFLTNNTIAYEVKREKESVTRPAAPDIAGTE